MQKYLFTFFCLFDFGLNMSILQSSIGKKIHSMNYSMNSSAPNAGYIDLQYIDSSYKYEDQLLKHLFKSYNPNLIPRRNSNETLKLYLGLAMIQLINMVNMIMF